ncbi:MAG TPA: hypothetical protein VMT67_13880 [Terriglobales bacterium]|nr:hypothetical protein [Terriglobales bacterium]
MIEILCFCLWLWLTVIGAFIGLAGEILMLPGRAIAWLGEVIVEFAEQFE